MKLNIRDLLREIRGMTVDEFKEHWKYALDRCYDRSWCKDYGYDYCNIMERDIYEIMVKHRRGEVI